MRSIPQAKNAGGASRRVSAAARAGAAPARCFAQPAALFALFALLLSTVVQADNLVSNYQDEDQRKGVGLDPGHCIAQGFVTGAEKATLWHITIRRYSGDTFGDSLRATILNADSLDKPGDTVEVSGLEVQDRVGAEYRIDVPAGASTVLDANTRYFLKLCKVGGNRQRLGGLDQDETWSETGESGWTVDDNGYRREDDDSDPDKVWTFSDSFIIKVEGSIPTTTTGNEYVNEISAKVVSNLGEWKNETIILADAPLSTFRRIFQGFRTGWVLDGKQFSDVIVTIDVDPTRNQSHAVTIKKDTSCGSSTPSTFGEVTLSSAGTHKYKIPNSFVLEPRQCYNLKIVNTTLPGDFLQVGILSTPHYGEDGHESWSIHDFHWANSQDTGRVARLKIEAKMIEIPTPVTGKPVVTGPPQTGQTVRAGLGTIADAAGLPANFPDDYTFQWYKKKRLTGISLGPRTEITGATDSTYLVKEADEGHVLSVKVSFTDNEGGSETVNSDDYPEKGYPNLAAVGKQLEDCPERHHYCAVMQAGVLRGAGQDWYGFKSDAGRGGLGTHTVGTDGEITFAQVLAERDEVDREIVEITILDVHGFSNTASDSVTMVTAGDEPLFPPEGTKVTIGEWTFRTPAASSVNGQSKFERTGGNIGNLRLEENELIRVSLLYPNRPAQGLPSISLSDLDGDGHPTEGETLTVDVSAVTDGDVLPSQAVHIEIGYQWVRADADGMNEEDIVDATGTSYTLTAADGGRKIRAKMLYTDSYGYDESPTSELYPAGARLVRSLNRPAEGKPTISGTPEVGETLTVDTSGISDYNGLTEVVWTYKWFRVDADAVSNKIEISGESDSVYTLSKDDVGKKIIVNVTFTDDEEYEESLSSDAYPSDAEITPRTLTGKLLKLGVANHDGKLHRQFRLRMNGPARVSYADWKNNVFDVHNGTIVKVKSPDGRELPQDELTAGRVRTFVVEPADIARPIGVAYTAKDDCAVQGAVCTRNGRRLKELDPIILFASEIPSVSIANASADESDGQIIFQVVISPPSRRWVWVNFTTTKYDPDKDGDSGNPATPSVDFWPQQTRLMLAPGQRTQGAGVALIDDSVDDANEKIQVEITEAWAMDGATRLYRLPIGKGTAIGNITNSDPIPKAWMSRFGRSVAVQTVDALKSRFGRDGQNHVTVGGIDFLGALTSQDPMVRGALDNGVMPLLDEHDSPLEPAAGPTSFEKLLEGGSFHLSSGGPDDSLSMSAWGNLDKISFTGEEDKVSVSGDVSSFMVGVDREWRSGLAGVMLSRSSGDGGYRSENDRGEVDSELTSVFPYVRYMTVDGSVLWGALGYGSGEVVVDELSPYKDPMNAPLSMYFAAAGAEKEVFDTDSGLFSVVLRTDAFWVRTKTEQVAGMAAASADASRMNLALLASRKFNWRGHSLKLVGDVTGRHDGGDAETGLGLDLGGGVNYSYGPMTVSTYARNLVKHEDSRYEEWKVMGSLGYSAHGNGRGLSFSIEPSWSGSHTGTENTHEKVDRKLILKTRYGAVRGRGFFTPYAGAELEGYRDWRIGMDYSLGSSVSGNVEVRYHEEDVESVVDDHRDWKFGMKYSLGSSSYFDVEGNFQKEESSVRLGIHASF